MQFLSKYILTRVFATMNGTFDVARCQNMQYMKKAAYHITSDQDLTKEQIYTTLQTYDRFAKKFADKWEWNPATVKEIKKYNIRPFMKYAAKYGKVLIVGCQTGRDYHLLSELGFSCLGVEYSYGLLSEAIKRVPKGIFIHLYPKSLPFLPGSFDAIYADMFTIIPKQDTKQILNDFRIFLKMGGILYISVKLGEKQVICLDDIGGKRYFALFRKEEIIQLLKSSGFTILWSQESTDTDSSLPNWFSAIGKK